MKQKLKYRIGEERDIPALNVLGRSSYGEFKNVLAEENWNTLDAILKNVDDTRSIFFSGTCFVCEDKGQIVGMIYYIPCGNPTDLYDNEWSYIRFLGVEPEYRGHGIARKLTLLCIEEAKLNKEKTIALHTSEMMEPAMALYSSLGFKQQMEFERFGVRYWIYLKTLT